MRDFISFLKHPYLNNSKEAGSPYYNFAQFFKSALLFGIIYICIGLVGFLYKVATPNTYEFIKHTYLEKFRVLSSHYGAFSIVIVCLIGPIAEELAFRLGFSFKKVHVVIGLVALAFALFFSWRRMSFSGNPALFAFLCGTIAIFAFFLKQHHLNYAKERFGTSLMHLFAISFAALHLMTLTPLHLNMAIGYMVMLLPILALSYILYYIRIRTTIVYSILFHMLFNAFIYLPTYIRIM